MQRFHGSPFWHQFRCGELCLATCPQTGDYTPFSSACQCSFLISYTSIYRRYSNLKSKKLIARWCELVVWPLDFMFERLRSNFTLERKPARSKHYLWPRQERFLVQSCIRDLYFLRQGRQRERDFFFAMLRSAQAWTSVPFGWKTLCNR